MDAVNRLLDRKEIDINGKDKYGYTALIWASVGGYLNVVKRLLDCQQTQIRQGFKLTYSHGFILHFPVDLIELIIEFTV